MSLLLLLALPHLEHAFSAIRAFSALRGTWGFPSKHSTCCIAIILALKKTS